MEEKEEIEALKIEIEKIKLELSSEKDAVIEAEKQYLKELLQTREVESELKLEIELLRSVEEKFNQKELFYTQLEERTTEFESENIELQRQINVETSQNEAMKTVLLSKECIINDILQENKTLESQLVSCDNFKQDLTTSNDSVQESIASVHMQLNELESEQTEAEDVLELNDMSNRKEIQEIIALKALLEREVEEKNLLKAEKYRLKEMIEELQKYIDEDNSHGNAVSFLEQAKVYFEDIKMIMQCLAEQAMRNQAEFFNSKVTE